MHGCALTVLSPGDQTMDLGNQQRGTWKRGKRKHTVMVMALSNEAAASSLAHSVEQVAGSASWWQLGMWIAAGRKKQDRAWRQRRTRRGPPPPGGVPTSQAPGMSASNSRVATGPARRGLSKKTPPRWPIPRLLRLVTESCGCKRRNKYYKKINVNEDTKGPMV